MSCHTRPHGEATGLVRRQKEMWGKPRPEPLMRLASVGKARLGRGEPLRISYFEQRWQAVGYRGGL